VTMYVNSVLHCLTQSVAFLQDSISPTRIISVLVRDPAEVTCGDFDRFIFIYLFRSIFLFRSSN